MYQITGDLGANPIENLQDRFGNWGLRFLLLSLAVTPCRRITGQQWLIRFRRMLGLFSFFYVLIHFTIWLLLDQRLLISAITEDISERPFIAVGFLSLTILAALAATSTMKIRSKLGRNWQKLHNCIYIAAVLGIWHYWWQVKIDATEPIIYALVLALLIGFRLRYSNLKRIV
tara:strand:- start:253 stop:771 length:519 start_codon:yes stop_codon:yes gene_type:complete